MKPILTAWCSDALMPEFIRHDLGFECPWGAWHCLYEEDGVYVVEVRDGADDDDDPGDDLGRLYGIFTIKPDDARCLRMLLAETRLPLTLGEDMPTGCDGSVTTLSFKKGGLGATYTWWSVIPRGWEHLAEIADIVLRDGCDDEMEEAED